MPSDGPNCGALLDWALRPESEIHDGSLDRCVRTFDTGRILGRPRRTRLRLSFFFSSSLVLGTQEKLTDFDPSLPT